MLEKDQQWESQQTGRETRGIEGEQPLGEQASRILINEMGAALVNSHVIVDNALHDDEGVDPYHAAIHQLRQRLTTLQGGNPQEQQAAGHLQQFLSGLHPISQD